MSSVATRRRSAVAALVIVVIASFSAEPSSDGPLRFGDGGGEAGAPVDIGTVITFGHHIARLDGSRPVTLEDAVLVPDGDATGATVEGAYVVDVDRLPGPAVGLARGFPPRLIPQSLLNDVDGLVLQPGPGKQKGYSFVFAVRVTKPGTWRFSGARIRYSADGDSYSVTSHGALQLCAPATSPCQPAGRSVGG